MALDETAEPQAPRWTKALPASFLVLALVYLIYAWDRVVVPVALVEIRGAYGLSPATSGLVASLFTLGLALMALPAGLIAAYLGVRNTLIAGAVLFSLFTAYIPVGHGVADLLGARVAAGVGEGLYNVALYSLLAATTTRYRGAAAGIASTLFGLGMLSGPPLVSAIQSGSHDWRTAFFVLAAAGLAGAAAIRLLVPRSRRDQASSVRSVVRRAIKTLGPQSGIILLATGINGVGVYAFLSIYVTFLRDRFAMDQATAALLLSAYGLGSLVGGLPMGLLADRLGRRPVLVVAMLAAGVMGAAAFLAAPAILPSMAVNVCLGVLLNGIYTNCYAAIQEQAAPEDLPIATGMVATVYFLTASFSGWLLVTAADHLGWASAALLVYSLPYALGAALLFIGARLARRDRTA